MEIEKVIQPKAGPLADLIGKVVKDDGKVYAVGGFVRDHFAGVKSKDLDIVVTGIPYAELKVMLAEAGRVDEVGKSFGIIKWTPEGWTDAIDVALPRKEVSTGDGHQDFDVHFDHRLSIEDDLARRDFSINAIAQDMETGEYTDPYKGRNDIKHKWLRVVGKDSFKDDPLRILRGMQFAARFRLQVDPNTSAMASKYSYLIRHLSKERIAIELGKMLSKGIAIDNTVRIMNNLDIWSRIFPEIGIPKPFLDSKTLCDMDLKMAALFLLGDLRHEVRSRTDVAEESMAELKLTAAGFDVKRILALIGASTLITTAGGNLPATKAEAASDIRHLAGGNPALLIDVLRVRSVCNQHQGKEIAHAIALIAEVEREDYPYSLKQLAINGNDLMQDLHVKGPLIGDLLEQLLDVVIVSPSSNTRPALLQVARKLI